MSWFGNHSRVEMSGSTKRSVAYAGEGCSCLISLHGSVIWISVPANSQSFKYDKQPHSHLLNRLKSYALFKPTRLCL